MKNQNMKRLLKKLAAVTFLLAAASTAQAVSSYQVQVGYADNIRPSPFFPSPWQGGAGVTTFAGGGSSYDAGAIRIINNGGTTITFGGMTVDGFGSGASFTLWGGWFGTTIAPGNSMILTQTVSYDFDTSDYQGGNPLAIPVVHLTIDGVGAAFSDTAQVLNTEGTDHLAQAGLNESHQWRDIGTFGGQAGSVPDATGFSILALSCLGMIGFGKWVGRAHAHP